MLFDFNVVFILFAALVYSGVIGCSCVHVCLRVRIIKVEKQPRKAD